MADIIGPTIGKIGTFLAWDGEHFRVVRVSVGGFLQTTVLSSALPTGAATQVTLLEVAARIGNEDTPGAGSVNAQLADLVTQIEKKTLDRFDSLYQVHDTDTAGAGNLNVYSPTLAAGKLAIVNHILIMITAGTAVTLELFRQVDVSGAATVYAIRRVEPPVADTEYLFTGQLVLEADDRIWGRVKTVGAGTTLLVVVHGYYVDIS